MKKEAASRPQGKEDRRWTAETKSTTAAASRKDKEATTAATANLFTFKTTPMARNKSDKQRVSNTSNNTNTKDRKGDTARTSNEGRKAASGGNKNTNNRGQEKGI
jgi:hypothetical protein